MAKATVTQKQKITSALERLTSKGGSTTVDKVAKAAKVDRAAVYRQVYNLRKQGKTITSSTQKVKGQRQTVYQVAV
jgi:predicted transcriptional regulator